MKDPFQQSYRKIILASEALKHFTALSLAEIGQLFKMSYLVVSQVAKRFEQKSKVNHEMREIKQKIIAALKEN